MLVVMIVVSISDVSNLLFFIGNSFNFPCALWFGTDTSALDLEHSVLLYYGIDNLDSIVSIMVLVYELKSLPKPHYPLMIQGTMVCTSRKHLSHQDLYSCKYLCH